MSLHKHYLPEDTEQLDANLVEMHQALVNILKCTTDADFLEAERSRIKFERSYQIVHALHKKKAARDRWQGGINVVKINRKNN